MYCGVQFSTSLGALGDHFVIFSGTFGTISRLWDTILASWGLKSKRGAQVAPKGSPSTPWLRNSYPNRCRNGKKMQGHLYLYAYVPLLFPAMVFREQKVNLLSRKHEKQQIYRIAGCAQTIISTIQIGCRSGLRTISPTCSGTLFVPFGNHFDATTVPIWNIWTRRFAAFFAVPQEGGFRSPCVPPPRDGIGEITWTPLF